MAFPADWNRRVKLTIPAAQVSGSGTHSGFPVYIARTNLPDEVVDPSGSNSAQADGGDLRVSSDEAGSSQLPLEVVAFGHDSTTGAGDASVELWVKRDLATGSDTNIYLWYNTGDTETQPATTDPAGRNAVWSDYGGVYHGDDPNDSTGNGNTLTANNAGASTGDTGGLIGDAFSFDGTSGARLTTLQSDITSDPCTISALFKPSTDDGSGQTIGLMRPDSDAENLVRLTYQGNAAGNPLRGQAIDEDGDNNFVDSAEPTVGAWNLGHVVVDSSGGVSVYLDGANKVTEATDTVTLTLELFAIGERKFNVSWNQTFNGLIDEVRFRLGTVSDGWVATEDTALTSPGTFITTGTPSDVSAPPLGSLGLMGAGI